MDYETIILIEAAMTAAERTKTWTAAKAGIPPTTFQRKLREGASFTVPEVARIAKALGVHPSELLPAVFAKAA